MNREEDHLGQDQKDENDANTADQGEKNGVSQSEDQKDLDAAHGQEKVNIVEQSEEVNRSQDIATTTERDRQAASSGSFAIILVNVVVPQAARSSLQTGGRLLASNTIFRILGACRYWWQLGCDHDNIWRQLCTMVWGCPEQRLQPTWMEEYLQQHWIRSGRAIRRQYLMYNVFSLFEGGDRVPHLAMTDTHVAAATNDGNDAIIFSLARPHLGVVRYRPVTSLGTNPNSSSGLFHFPPREATIAGLILLRDWLLFGLSGGHIFAISELGPVRQTRPEDMLRHLGWNRRNNIVSFAVQPTRFGNLADDGYMIDFRGNSNWSIGLFMAEYLIGGKVRIWRRINGREFEIGYDMLWDTMWPFCPVWTHIDDLTAIVLRRNRTWMEVIPLRVLERNLEEGVRQYSVPIVVPFEPPIQACPPAVSNGRMAAVDAGLTVWIRGGENYQDVLWRIQTPVERGLPAGNETISLFLNSRYFLVSSGHGINVYEADTGNFCYTLRREVWRRWSPSIRLIVASQRHVVAWAHGLICWDLDSRAGRRLGER